MPIDIYLYGKEIQHLPTTQDKITQGIALLELLIKTNSDKARIHAVASQINHNTKILNGGI